MDCIVDPLVGRIAVRKSTQIGWSEILNNVIGYFIDADPKPIMMVQPREADAKKYSRKRIAPMIEACPSLRDKVRESKSRDGANTMLLKEFPGGFLTLGFAKSAASLRSDPIAILLEDECDAYDLDVDNEGSPSEIAEHRTETFDDAKVLIGSTPAKPKGFSLIDEEYKESSQGLYQVPCPACNDMQPLFMRDPDTNLYNLIYEKDEDSKVITDSVRYLCRKCKHGIDEKWKQKMLDAGGWLHRFPDMRDGRGLFRRGFHLNAFYSPWRPIWASLAQKWVRATDNPQKLKTFINLSLAETFEEGGENVETSSLIKRKESFQAIAAVPKNCAVLIASVDVQHNRLECQITGFGPGEESWLIDHEVFWGDPGNERSVVKDADNVDQEVNVWKQLDDHLLQPYPHECGAQLMPAIVLIDSGDGGNTDSVYDYVLVRQHTRRRIFACKGVEYLSKPGLASEGTTKRQNIRLWTVATTAAKDRILARLKIAKPGPGYMHFPEWVTEEYFDQLTAEVRMPKPNRVTRKAKFVYVQQHPRNEALDLTVYAHAGLFVLQNFLAPGIYRDLPRLLARVQEGKLIAPQSGGRRVRSRGI